MVRDLPEPARPLTNGTPWTWRWTDPTPQQPWGWCRISHVAEHTPDGLTHRDYGPLARFDPHVPGDDGQPTAATPRRSVLYVADSLTTAIGEVFGDLYPTASICPGYRVALLRPAEPLTLVDLASPVAAMRLGALPALSSTPGPREHTQNWARAIYEDNPLPEARASSGIRYRTANADGHALALWGTDDQVAIIRDGQGMAQDLSLAQNYGRKSSARSPNSGCTPRLSHPARAANPTRRSASPQQMHSPKSVPTWWSVRRVG